jgi:hypothetical protein
MSDLFQMSPPDTPAQDRGELGELGEQLSELAERLGGPRRDGGEG